MAEQKTYEVVIRETVSGKVFVKADSWIDASALVEYKLNEYGIEELPVEWKFDPDHRDCQVLEIIW